MVENTEGLLVLIEKGASSPAQEHMSSAISSQVVIPSSLNHQPSAEQVAVWPLWLSMVPRTWPTVGRNAVATLPCPMLPPSCCYTS